MRPTSTSATDGSRRSSLLASAIAGRPVEVATAAPDEPAWSDGTTIFVAGSRPSVVVQAALIGAGSLDDDGVIAALGRRPALAARYLAVEGHRALTELQPLLPPWLQRLADPRLADRTGSPAASLALARSREPLPDPPAEFGTIHPRRVVRPRPAAGQATDAIAQPTRPDLLAELDDDEGTPLPEWFTSPVGGGGPLGRLLSRMLGQAPPGAGSSGPTGAGEASRWTGRPSGVAAGGTPTVSAPVAEAGGGGFLTERRGATYPEWDVHRRSYRPGWCTVREMLPERAGAPAAGPVRSTTIDTHLLRRRLAPIGTDLERRHRQLQGDDLDIDAVVEARVDLACGSAPDEAVYVDRVRRRRDLAVLLLLDVSGSAGEPSPAGGRVHDHQRAAAAALALSLHGLGDRVALYGFRSQGRARVEMIPVTRFADPVDAAALTRLDCLTPGAYNRLGAAIRHGTALLETESGTPRRLLVVLSDGFAYDHGYEGPYGEADARRALAEARRGGTGSVCLSIGADTEPAALLRVFGTAAHAAIARPEQLADVVAPLFRLALQSAEAQRRAYQRRAYQRRVRTRGLLTSEGRRPG